MDAVLRVVNFWSKLPVLISQIQRCSEHPMASFLQIIDAVRLEKLIIIASYFLCGLAGWKDNLCKPVYQPLTFHQERM